jgi:single-strand DNA-binding protein
VTAGLNKAIIIGRLGRSPEMRYTPGGKPVTSFSVITTYSWLSSNGEHHEETDWFNIIAWGDLAERCKHALRKGQQIYIEGRMKTRRWHDANDVPCSCAEVVAHDVIALQDEPPLS